MSAATRHPATRFKAPSTILAGTPLKTLIGRPLVRLISESFALATPGFPSAAFERNALQGLEGLELSGRGEHLARCLQRHLPGSFDKAADLLIAALGPELTETEGNGLAPFFYFPHAHYVKLFGVEHVEAGLRTNYELTKRFTAEFSIRPFLLRHPERTLDRLRLWTTDPNPHVRRLVSEGSRPRLPWATRLPPFQKDPTPVLDLLERLRKDPSVYVLRSVANNLGDIAKDHPARVFETCRRWLEEFSGDDPRSPRLWMIRHAVRLPAKKGVTQALQIRRDARG